VSDNDRLRELRELLQTISSGQHLPDETVASIQQVLDEAIISVIESGGSLPAFVLENDRISSARARLGSARVADIAARPLPEIDRDTLIPLVARLFSAFDALCQSSASGHAASNIINLQLEALTRTGKRITANLMRLRRAKLRVGEADVTKGMDAELVGELEAIRAKLSDLIQVADGIAFPPPELLRVLDVARRSLADCDDMLSLLR
jgi:hypothetical protein